jgi:hypothetical protein
VHAEIIRQLLEDGYDVHNYTVDVEDFRHYYGGGGASNFTEKALRTLSGSEISRLGRRVHRRREWRVTYSEDI